MVKGIKIQSRILNVAGFLAAVLILSACTPAEKVIDETDERSYRRGKSLLREGREDEALLAFLSVIGSRPDAVESHLESGLIYLNHIGDPLAAVYHFRNYLSLAPEGEHVELVRELLLTAQKDFAQSLPGKPFGEAVDRVNLIDEVKKLQEENRRYKEQALQLQSSLAEAERRLVQARAQLARRSESPSGPAEVAPIVIQQAADDRTGTQAETPATYTVQSGDTLSRISNRVYGTSSRWMDIFQANRDQLPSPNALKPGQTLKIP